MRSMPAGCSKGIGHGHTLKGDTESRCPMRPAWKTWTRMAAGAASARIRRYLREMRGKPSKPSKSSRHPLSFGWCVPQLGISSGSSHRQALLPDSKRASCGRPPALLSTQHSRQRRLQQRRVRTRGREQPGPPGLQNTADCQPAQHRQHRGAGQREAGGGAPVILFHSLRHQRHCRNAQSVPDVAAAQRQGGPEAGADRPAAVTTQASNMTAQRAGELRPWQGRSAAAAQRT